MRTSSHLLTLMTCACIATDQEDAIRARVDAWNTHLHTHVSDFASSTPRARILLFSSYAVLADVIDSPEEYDITEEDVWVDELHLSAMVHAVLAEKLVGQACRAA